MDVDVDGVFDEVAVRDVAHVHVERMDDGHVWMKIESSTGDALVLNFTTNRRVPIHVRAEYEPSPRAPRKP